MTTPTTNTRGDDAVSRTPGSRPSGAPADRTARPGQSGHPGGRGEPARRDPADLAQLEAHPVSYRRIGALFAPHRSRLAVVVLLIVASSAIA